MQDSKQVDRFQTLFNRIKMDVVSPWDQLVSELTNVAARSDVTSPSTSSPRSERGVYDSFFLHVSTDFLPQESICLVSHSPLEGLVLREVIVVAGSNGNGFPGTRMSSLSSSFLHLIETMFAQRFSVLDLQSLGIAMLVLWDR